MQGGLANTQESFDTFSAILQAQGVPRAWPFSSA